MKPHTILPCAASFVLLLGAVAGFALEIGDTYGKLLAEKGEPISQASVGVMKILNYEETTVRLSNDVVIAVAPIPRRSPKVSPEKAGSDAAKGLWGSRKSSGAKMAWTTDHPAAIARARREGKKVFLFFTGSDWCGWCKRLDKEVLTKPEFSAYAAENLVTVKLDFPRSGSQPADLKTQNQTLARKYGVRGYPTVILLGPDGRELGRMGYQAGGPKPYVARLRRLGS